MKQAKSEKHSKKIDLHIHTYYSDGDCSPSDVVRMAYKQAVSTIAITDHDTVSGLEEAITEGKRLGVEVIPGIEITTRNRGSVHILGYFPGKDIRCIEGIEESLEATRQGRTQRTYEQIDLLNQDGYSITKEEVDVYRKGEFTSKVHVIKAMIEKGYIKKTKEGIKLMEDEHYDIHYSTEWAMKPEDAVALINFYGGIAVLAHPGKLMKKHDINKFVQKLVKVGLKGLEIYSPKNSPEQMCCLSEIAEKYGLIGTYGTDFHREGSTKIGVVDGANINPADTIYHLKKSHK
ncbi:PHP domain-containing protein [candidate division KSB1 bacterium]